MATQNSVVMHGTTEERLEAELVGMGFSKELSREAVHATTSDGLQAALDWLLISVTSVTPPGTARRQSTEEAMLTAAIEASLVSVQQSQQSADPFPGGFDPFPTNRGHGKVVADEEADLQAAIAISREASDSQETRGRRDSELEIEEAERLFAQMETSGVPTLAPSNAGKSVPEEPSLPLPEAMASFASEALMLQLLERDAPSAMVIAKAALVLRRRAASARHRTASNSSEADGTISAPGSARG